MKTHATTASLTLLTLSFIGVYPARAQVDKPAPKIEHRKNEFTVQGSALKAVWPAEVAKKPALRDFVRKIEGWSNSAIIYTVDGPLFEIQSETLAAMFPKWTFHIVPYREERHPDTKELVSIAGGLYFVIATNERGERVEFFGYNNHDDFGAFLASNKIRLRNNDDAKKIWTAYCHTIRHDSPTIESKKADATTWKLGWRMVMDNREYYYEVQTLEDGTIKSGSLRNVPAKKK